LAGVLTQSGSPLAGNIVRVLAGEGEWASFVVEEESIWAEFLCCYTIRAFVVGIALAGVGVVTIAFWAVECCPLAGHCLGSIVVLLLPTTVLLLSTVVLLLSAVILLLLVTLLRKSLRPSYKGNNK